MPFVLEKEDLRFGKRRSSFRWGMAAGGGSVRTLRHAPARGNAAPAHGNAAPAHGNAAPARV